MIEDWFEDGFAKPHAYGEDVLVNPGTILFVPARINLRATMKSDREIEDCGYVGICKYHKHERMTGSLFWSENLVPSEGHIYVFETKYCTKSDDILPASCLGQIPEKLRREFTRPVPNGISELADKLVGDETDTIKLLGKFFVFVGEHLEPEMITTGKPVEQLLEEYQSKGHFYGNCKEARDFYIALCDSRGYPSKRVSGKSAKRGGHVWVDVFVPVGNGYRLLPVDPALIYFGNFNPDSHYFFEYTPETVPKTPDAYKLKIEHVD